MMNLYKFHVWRGGGGGGVHQKFNISFKMYGICGRLIASEEMASEGRDEFKSYLSIKCNINLRLL